MKKIRIQESQHNRCIMTMAKLPKFLFDKIITHKNYLGDNAAFPPEEDYPFDYKVLKNRYQQVIKTISKFQLESLEYEYLHNRLGKLIKECMELEKPFKTNLCKLCENIVNDLFKIPIETVNLYLHLVDKVKPTNSSYRTLPETSEHRKFEFEDMNDFHNVSKVILKRRLINSLIQGASYTYSTMFDIYGDDVSKLDKRLMGLYEEIIAINDYLLFTKEIKIDDENPMQVAYVEVELGVKGKKTNITSQGLIFPFLLTETIRGFFELFASHGLPEEQEKALYVIKQSDFLAAEPWDLRMGVDLWSFIGDFVENTQLLPYMMMSICELKVDDFNSFMQEVFAKTKKGQQYLQELTHMAQKEYEKMDFLDTIKMKNFQKSLIADEDFSLDELENYTLSEGLLKEYMSTWRLNSIQQLVNQISNDLMPLVGRKKFEQVYNYSINEIEFPIRVQYRPNKHNSDWSGTFDPNTNEILISFIGKINPRMISTAIHHEITHYVNDVREKKSGMNFYKRYDVDMIKIFPNTALVQNINTIIYRLWDDDERQTYQTNASQGIKYVQEYCDQLSEILRLIENDRTKHNAQIWINVNQNLIHKNFQHWGMIKTYFLNHSKKLLSDFRKKALKNAYMYQQYYGSDSYTQDALAFTEKNTQKGNLKHPANRPQTNDSGGVNIFKVQRKFGNGLNYLSKIGHQILEICPQSQGEVTIGDEKYTINLIYDTNKRIMTLSIPALNSTIQVKMDESFNNKTNDKAIEIGKEIFKIIGQKQ